MWSGVGGLEFSCERDERRDMVRVGVFESVVLPAMGEVRAVRVMIIFLA
jgi:hypothetical protein